LERLLGYAKPFFRAGARGLFLKGERAEEEIAEARKRWRFEVALTPSLSDPSGRIVQIERLARA
jgi:16S rRNA (guanine527-N7)-methyltransferase